MLERREPRPHRRAVDQPPAWAQDLADDVADMRQRLSRIEGGLLLAGTIATLIVMLAAGHVISIHLP